MKTMIDEPERGVEGYKKTIKNKVLWIVLFLVILIVVFIISLYLGSTRMSISEIIYNIFLNPFNANDTWFGYVTWDVRIKRSVAAIIAGCGLGVAGAAMQCVLKNPLGSPYTLGMSNAAAFGAALGIIILNGGAVIGQSVASYQINNPYIVTISAFLFSMVATAIIILMMRVINASPETMVLTGMALSAIFSAGIAFLQYSASDMTLSAIVFWQFGDLEKIGWDHMWIIALATAVVIIILYCLRWDLNAIDAGDDVAKALGVNVSFLRISVLTFSAIVTAVIVSFVGIIGFIGLLAPHLAREVVGNDKRFLIPMSMLIGAVVLMIAMIIGENAFEFTVPVGIITSVIGGPLFIYILLKGYSRKGIC